MSNFKTIMIRMKDSEVSREYASYCAESWQGFNLKFFDAITPETLPQQSGLTFGKRGDRELTDTEKACFYSQYILWKKAAVENMPILVLEHDAWLENPAAIAYNPHLHVQFFGQHAMEAVMINPIFAKRLMKVCERTAVTGPMTLVDTMLGFFNKRTQSRDALPHARFMGKYAPVRTVIDPTIGTTVQHDKTTAQRLYAEKELFKVVNIEEELGKDRVVRKN